MSEKETARAEQERYDLETVTRWQYLMGRLWTSRQVQDEDYWSAMGMAALVEGLLPILQDKADGES